MIAVRLGTRGSQLALAQSGMVAGLLRRAHPGLNVEMVEISTAGDRDQTSALAEGVGWFTSAIQEALQRGEIDVAVHSYKDLPTARPEGLVIAAVPMREDAHDALVSGRGAGIAGLPPGAVLGTSSPRREAQLRALRPDLVFRPIRGNVDTRLAKVRSGEYDATVLAVAGLKRLGLDGAISQVFEYHEMLPAPAQGALAVECREADAPTRSLLRAIDAPALGQAVAAERAFLAKLGAGCTFPAAAHAEQAGNALELTALIARDGQVVRSKVDGPASTAEEMGTMLAERLMAAVRMGAGN